MKYLITGGCGFIGSNLSAEVLKRKEKLCVLDNLSRIGSSDNLKWLKCQGDLKFINSDIRVNSKVDAVVRDFNPDVIFHLAGQVAMTKSIEDPRHDFEVNTIGTLNVLEAVRKHHPATIIIYSSTNKVYGDLENVRYVETKTRYLAPDYPAGFSEMTPLDFRSPYGCSKGAADQYVLDYYRIFGLKTVVFRHSSIYGERQFSTYDQGWIGWFCQKAIEAKKCLQKKPFTISGNGKQVRDILYMSDIVKLYFNTIKNINRAKGKVFNIGGGMKNSLSLLELFNILEKELDVKLSYKKLSQRESDQKVFVADIDKAKKIINWQPEINSLLGIRKMIEWVKGNI
jgi:CDP-paratose 2-epimerase